MNSKKNVFLSSLQTDTRRAPKKEKPKEKSAESRRQRTVHQFSDDKTPPGSTRLFCKAQKETENVKLVACTAQSIDTLDLLQLHRAFQNDAVQKGTRSAVLV